MPMSSRRALLALLPLLSGTAHALDVPARYLVNELPLKISAVSGTNLTFELFDDSACTNLVLSSTVAIDDVRVVSRLNPLTPRRGARPPKSDELLVTLTGAPASGPLYLRVSGPGVTPIGTACQVQ